MSKPIRVLHIVTTMNRGGLETMIMNYYRNIDREKIQFDFLEHRSEISDYDQEIEKLGGKIFRISALNPFSKVYKNQLDMFFKEHNYEIIHVHQDCLSTVALKIAKKNNIPIRIAHSHNSSQDKNIKYIIKLIYKKGIKKYATSLFACGYQAGTWIFETNNFLVMNNAINTKDFLFNTDIRNRIRTELNIENRFVVGHIGRFCEPKNHDFIIDVFNELLKINQNSYLILVGTGELEEKIIKKVHKLNLQNNVLFYGISQNVNELLQAFDVFLFPSLYEGLPVTMIEAQASGIKCFISEKVPKETIICDNVEILKLDDTPTQWALEMNKYCLGYERKNMFNEIENHHFDIVENAKWMEKKYLEMVK